MTSSLLDWVIAKAFIMYWLKEPTGVRFYYVLKTQRYQRSPSATEIRRCLRDFKGKDVLPEETLWESFMLTCSNWPFTLWWAKRIQFGKTSTLPFSCRHDHKYATFNLGSAQNSNFFPMILLFILTKSRRRSVEIYKYVAVSANF